MATVTSMAMMSCSRENPIVEEPVPFTWTPESGALTISDARPHTGLSIWRW
ncbi:MAG: hypothetical protein LBT48_01205 [Prevotellaceae bacterium]|nr:hypothetical protein [Prevotellaceae bacterium]